MGVNCGERASSQGRDLVGAGVELVQNWMPDGVSEVNTLQLYHSGHILKTMPPRIVSISPTFLSGSSEFVS